MSKQARPTKPTAGKPKPPKGPSYKQLESQLVEARTKVELFDELQQAYQASNAANVRMQGWVAALLVAQHQSVFAVMPDLMSSAQQETLNRAIANPSAQQEDTPKPEDEV